MLAKIKIIPPGRGLLVTKHIEKSPENRDTPFEPAAGCAPSYQRVDAAENILRHYNESLKGWIVKKAVDPFGLPA